VARHRGDKHYLTGLFKAGTLRDQLSLTTAAPPRTPDMPAVAEILQILTASSSPTDPRWPDSQILAAMGLTSAGQLTARQALAMLGSNPLRRPPPAT